MKLKKQQYSLKELRARRNMTQAELAKILGISTQTYNAWEKDISNVAIGKVKSIADFYGITIGEIFLPTDMKNIHVRIVKNMNICNGKEVEAIDNNTEVDEEKEKEIEEKCLERY